MVLPYLKAVVGFIAPGAVVIGAAVTPGSDAGTAITQAELVTAAVACVVTAAGVWATPNITTRAARRRATSRAARRRIARAYRAEGDARLLDRLRGK